MNESIGQIIKRLRKERGLTQEELAERLNISAPAISKWENDTSMPDISQIVPLAGVFGVRTDVLFGLHTDGANAAVAEVKKIAELPETDNDRRVELWSDLLKQYPNNNEIRRNLAKAYLCRKKEGDYAAAAELFEKILDECTDSEIRLKSLSMLCFCYNRMGDTQNAVRVAKLCGPSHITTDSLLAKIDGYEGRDEVNQRLLAYSVQEAAWCLMRQSYPSDADAVFAHRTAIRMLDLLYYDGDKARISHVYITLRTALSKLLARIGDHDAMYAELENWLNDVIFEDSLPTGDYHYSGNIFLNLTTQQHHHSESRPGWGLECMQHCADFDKVRDTEEFQKFWKEAQERYHREVLGAFFRIDPAGL